MDPGTGKMVPARIPGILAGGIRIIRPFDGSGENFFEKSKNFVCICEKMGYNRME